eukprot:3816328-Rhodomonas_salina.2
MCDGNADRACERAVQPSTLRNHEPHRTRRRNLRSQWPAQPDSARRNRRGREWRGDKRRGVDVAFAGAIPRVKGWGNSAIFGGVCRRVCATCFCCELSGCVWEHGVGRVLVMWLAALAFLSGMLTS